MSSNNSSSGRLQDWIERNIFAMFVGLLLVLSVGGLVEIVPLFYLDSTCSRKRNKYISKSDINLGIFLPWCDHHSKQAD